MMRPCEKSRLSLASSWFLRLLWFMQSRERLRRFKCRQDMHAAVTMIVSKDGRVGREPANTFVAEAATQAIRMEECVHRQHSASCMRRLCPMVVISQTAQSVIKTVPHPMYVEQRAVNMNVSLHITILDAAPAAPADKTRASNAMTGTM
jgi:hypothetical protein